MRARRWIVATGGLAVVVAAGAVGTTLVTTTAAGARTPSKPAVVTAAETVCFDLSVSVVAGGTTYAGTVIGQADLATGEVAATIDIPAGFGSVLSAIDPSIATLVPAAVDADTTAQMVFAHRTLYLSLAGLSFGAKQWVSFPVSGAGMSALKLVARGLRNPRYLSKLAKSLGATVTSLGTEVIGGVPADGYSTVLPVTTLLDAIPGLGSAIVSEVGADLGSTLPVDVWVERGGPVLQISVDLTPPAGSPIGSVDVSLGLNNWGAPVTITVPGPGDSVRIPVSL